MIRIHIARPCDKNGMIFFADLTMGQVVETMRDAGFTVGTVYEEHSYLDKGEWSAYIELMKPVNYPPLSLTA